MKRLAVPLFVTIAALAGCARRSPPMVSEIDAQRANVELADLQQGRQLLIGKCTNCHKAPLPDDHAATEWPRMLDEMSARANLGFKDRLLIEKYLVTMSTR